MPSLTRCLHDFLYVINQDAGGRDKKTAAEVMHQIQCKQRAGETIEMFMSRPDDRKNYNSIRSTQGKKLTHKKT